MLLPVNFSMMPFPSHRFSNNDSVFFEQKQYRWVLKISLVRFWIYFRGKIGSKRGSVASYVTDFTYDLGRKETKR